MSSKSKLFVANLSSRVKILSFPLLNVNFRSIRKTLKKNSENTEKSAKLRLEKAVIVTTLLSWNLKTVEMLKTLMTSKSLGYIKIHFLGQFFLPSHVPVGVAFASSLLSVLKM